MSDRMDLDRLSNGPKAQSGPKAPSSRDPRLVSRPPKPQVLRTTSLDRQPLSAVGSPKTPGSAVHPLPAQPTNDSTPVEKPDETPGGSFIQAVSGLVQAAVATAMSKSEKEKLQKRKENTEVLLRKARAHTNFPSTAAFFQQASNDENMDLTRMDDAINEHLANCNQIEKVLTGKWGSLSSNDSKSQILIKELQNELRVAKSDISCSKAEIERLTQLLGTDPSQTGHMKALQDRVIFLERAMGNQSSVLNGHAKNAKANEERLTTLSSEVKNRPMTSQVPEGALTQFKSEIEHLKSKHTAMDSGIREQLAFQEKIFKSLDQMNKDIETQRKKLSGINFEATVSMEKRMDSFYDHLTSPQAVDANGDSKDSIRNLEQRLKTLEGKPVASPNGNGNYPSIQGVNALNGRIDELAHLQAMKDDLQFSEMEDIRKTLTQQGEQFDTFKDTYGLLSAEVKQNAQNIPVAVLHQFQTLSGALQTTQRVVETVKIGLHSLETRYNNLTTEPIVKNMVVAMQELYPSTTQLMEQVSALRSNFEKELVPLRSKVDHVIKSHASHGTLMQQETGIRLDEINRLKADHARIDQSLIGLWERTNTAGSPSGQLQFRQLQLICEALSKRLDQHVSESNEQFKAKQMSDDALLQGLHDEREHFSKEFEQLSTEFKTLSRKFSEVDSASAGNLEAIKTQWSDISSLLDRMRHVEESVSENHNQLLEQFDNVKKAVEDQEGQGSKNNGALSPQEKIEGNEEQDDLAESPANNIDDSINQVAEIDPALALREKKKKKKRSRFSNLSDDERPTETQSDSPRVSTPMREGTPSEKKKSKKKKKRRLLEPEPIPLD